jgi:hypothetical protein
MTTTEVNARGETESVHLVAIDRKRGKWSNAKGKYSREHHRPDNHSSATPT